jgi:hypothetical protein
MSLRTGAAVSLALLVLCSLAPPFASPAAALPRNVAETPALRAEEKAAGFALLFNGSDLSGWEHNGKPGTFEVKDGVLVGLRKKDSAYWLSTIEQQGDFELRLQYRIRAHGNSGVFIRAPREGRTSQMGMEIQIYDEGPDKKTPDKGSTGSIYGVVAPRKFADRGPGEWNDLWIACDGDLVRVTINGELVNEARMSDYEALKSRPRRGYIGLSAHTDVVEFRNIRLRPIRAAR